MMAGCAYVVIGPMDFWMGFVISEVIAQISSIEKEGLLMVNKLCSTALAFAKRNKSRAVAAWEIHLPYGLSLLMSL